MNTFYFQTFETRPDFFFYYKVTWESLLSVLRDERVVVIDAGASPEFLALIPKRFEIVKDNNTARHTDMWQGYPAFKRIYQQTVGDPNDQIVCCDARDMLFQRNPFDDMKPGLTLLAEGIHHGICQWNTDDQNRVRENIFKSIPEPIEAWPVLCPGAYGGTRRMVRWMALMVWQMCSLQLKGGTDQGAFNYIANQHLLPGDPDVRICDPRTDDWCLGGHDFRVTPATWKDERIVNPVTGRPYAMVHQWDRTAWRETTIGKWK